jgi:hypothetical protein
MLERRNLISNPGAMHEAIKRHWMEIALSGAFNSLQTELDEEFFQLLRRAMPKYLNIGKNEVHDFLQRLQLGDSDTKRPTEPKAGPEAFSPCSGELQRLVDYAEIW